MKLEYFVDKYVRFTFLKVCFVELASWNNFVDWETFLQAVEAKFAAGAT